MRPTILIFSWLVVAGLGRPGTTAAQAIADRIRARLAADGPPPVVAFYAARGFGPVWVTERGPQPAARELVAVLERAREDGLDPGDYGTPALRAALDRTVDPDGLTGLELQLTGALITFASDLSAGRVEPAEADSMWTGASDRRPDPAALAVAVDVWPVAEMLGAVRPRHEGYALLRVALDWYRTIAGRGGWPTVSGARGLRERLAGRGDLVGAGDDSTIREAVRRFQRRHGLGADGVVGPATLAALNVPVEERIHQIELNLERLRWLPRDLGRRHLAVNIPAFTLEVIEDGRPVLTMPVVVGRSDWQTPMVSAAAGQVVFGPAWHVPRSIAVEELVPLARNDPAALVRQHIRVFADTAEAGRSVEVSPESVDWDAVTDSTFAYRLVQDPGPDNPLGRVKLYFPNRFGVALHDTPDHALFGLPHRVASHGCVRVARAADLVNYLLGDVPPWIPDSVAAAMALPVERWVTLPQPIPVHLVYWTAWVDDTGVLQFRADAYSWDATLARALAERSGGRTNLLRVSRVLHGANGSFPEHPTRGRP